MDETLEEFLAELATLSKKYGLYIAGCGCDGSPWIYSTNGGTYQVVAEHLDWNDSAGEYEVTPTKPQKVGSPSRPAYGDP